MRTMGRAAPALPLLLLSAPGALAQDGGAVTVSVGTLVLLLLLCVVVCCCSGIGVYHCVFRTISDFKRADGEGEEDADAESR